MIENTLSNEDDLFPGQIIGSRYSIEKKIGSGGMAKVYAAYDRKLRIRTALKVLNKKHYSDTEFVKRFYREAQAAAKLNHRSIARVYDVNEIDGLHCIVMELVEGKTLEEVIEEKEVFFSPEEACWITREILNGLEYAHKEGIIHRDIKPRNIMLDKERNIKIADFGIAKLLPQQDMPEQTLLTKDGSLLGTPHYMSPEQLRGEMVSGRTDVFSTGILLYQMLTQRLPFNNVLDKKVNHSTDHATAISNILTKGLKRPKLTNRKISQKLEDIILKALEKNPDKRYDAKEFCSTLDSYLEGEKVIVEGRFRRRFEISRREFLVKGALGALGMAALIGTPTLLIIKKNEYEKSLYSTLNKIQEARTWEEMKPHLQELKIKLFDWVLERAKYLRKDAGAFQFKENKEVIYTDNSFQGFQFIRDIYSMGFEETKNPDFLNLFIHFYDLVKFDDTKKYQFYLDRFGIDYDELNLLKDANAEKENAFKEKMKLAIHHLISERYNRTGKFFQYINKNDEQKDEQIIYACTQYYLMPLLVEGFKISDTKKGLIIAPSEYLDFIKNQTKTSNQTLVDKDGGVHFGAVIYTLSRKQPTFFFKAKHSHQAYLSDDMIKYCEYGLQPIIQLYDSIMQSAENKKSSDNLTLEGNICGLGPLDIKKIKEEKTETINTFLKILSFYRTHLKSDALFSYYIPSKDGRFEENNPSNLSATIHYYNLINSLLNNPAIFLNYFNKEEWEMLFSERTKGIKTICQKENFNSIYSSSNNQSFFNRILYDISDPTIVSSTETEREFLKIIEKIK